MHTYERNIEAHAGRAHRKRARNGLSDVLLRRAARGIHRRSRGPLRQQAQTNEHTTARELEGGKGV